jgi:hypothetical protein
MSSAEDPACSWWIWTRRGWARYTREIPRELAFPFFFLHSDRTFDGVVREKQPSGWTVVCAHYNRSTLSLVAKGAGTSQPPNITDKLIFEYCGLDVDKTRRDLGVVFRSV